MDKLEKKLQEYRERFREGFPTFQLMRSRTDDEVIEIIDECLEKGRDAYDLGYVSDDPGMDY